MPVAGGKERPIFLFIVMAPLNRPTTIVLLILRPCRDGRYVVKLLTW